MTVFIACKGVDTNAKDVRGSIVGDLDAAAVASDRGA